MSLTKRRPTFLRFLICLVIGLGLAFGLLFMANPYYETFMEKSLLRSGYFIIAAIAGLVIALFLVFPTRKPLRLFKWLGRLIIMAVVVSLIFAVGLILEVQNDMMFFPGRSDTQDEAALLLNDKVEAVSPKSQNTAYSGYFYKKTPEKAPLLIYFGGNAELAASRMNGLISYADTLMQSTNYHILVVDYPGYAKSGGTPGETSIKDMARATMDYALTREDVDQDKIVLMGWSLGTGPVTYLASEYKVAGVILLAPFYNGTALVNGFIHNQMNVEDRFYTNLPTFLITNKFPSNEYAKKTEEKTLVLAARDDKMIPYEQAERLSGEFVNAQFKLFEGGHNSLLSNAEPLQAILVFLGEVAGVTPPPAITTQTPPVG